MAKHNKSGPISMCRVILKVQWVPGHISFTPNTKADTDARKAAKGSSSPDNLPKTLRRALPHSISAMKRLLNHHRWIQKWKASLRYPKIHATDKSMPSKKWLQLILGLSHTGPTHPPVLYQPYPSQQIPTSYQTV